MNQPSLQEKNNKYKTTKQEEKEGFLIDGSIGARLDAAVVQWSHMLYTYLLIV